MKRLVYIFFLFAYINSFASNKNPDLIGDQDSLEIEIIDTTKNEGKIPISVKDYDNHKIEMADGMRSEGKIYILVVIILIILLGLIGYTIHIDRKLSKLEKQ